MSVHTLLPRLRNVKRTGPGRWIASCPTREDKRPSMSIRELSDGRVLIHDFGGSAVHEILEAAGLTFNDLFPERKITSGKRERRPFPAEDVLRCIAFEALIIALSGRRVLAGELLSEEDQARVMTAVGRIEEAIQLSTWS